MSHPQTILLIHGAFADASSWARVIPLLQEAGHAVLAVQMPLISFEEDCAAVRRALDRFADCPVVAVAHSYGGAVMTACAGDYANVRALVYVAAHAPDDGEKLAELRGRFGPSALGAATRNDAGFVSIEPEKLHAAFAADLSEAEAHILATTQKPIAAVCYEGAPQRAAWHTIPAHYLVTTDDQAIKPELQRFMAKRAGARTQEIAASHVPMLSQPQAAAGFILTSAH